MIDPTQKPVIFLAFAQDREDKVGYLRNLPTELDGIRKALQKTRSRSSGCEVVERANTTVDNILDVFQEYRDRVAIFPYGGHAGSYELLLESASGQLPRNVRLHRSKPRPRGVIGGTVPCRRPETGPAWAGGGDVSSRKNAHICGHE